MSGELADALLSIGLEDEIPLWEAAVDAAVRAAVGGQDVVVAVGGALRTLLLAGLAQVSQGHWDAEADEVPVERALELVADPVWYRYPPEDHRVYYINVSNIREK